MGTQGNAVERSGMHGIRIERMRTQRLILSPPVVHTIHLLLCVAGLVVMATPPSLLKRWVDFASKIPILNLAQKLAVRSTNSRAFQETMDTQRVYMAAKYNQLNLEKFKQQGQNANVTYDDVPEKALSRLYLCFVSLN